jgi:hypothetical protein
MAGSHALPLASIGSLGLLLFAAVSVDGGDSPIAIATLADPHEHVVRLASDPTLAPEVEIVASEPPPGRARENEATSPNGKWRAFTTALLAPPDRIFFEAAVGGAVFEIRGLPMSHRPFSALAWLDDRHLVFDRWSQPHYGVHYVIDVEERRVVELCPFPDRWFLEQQRQPSE